MLTPSWKYLDDIISDSLHMSHIPVNTFLEFPTGDFKNVYIFLSISLLEKQNGYYGDNQGKNPVMC